MMIRAIVTEKQMESLNHLLFIHSAEQLCWHECSAMATAYPHENQYDVVMDTDWNSCEWIFMSEDGWFKLKRAEQRDHGWYPVENGLEIKFAFESRCKNFICLERFQ